MYIMEPKGGSHPPPPQKSLFVAYIYWLFGGLFGLHHFYLRRDTHAFLTWATVGGYFGFGWLRDGWMLPEYVRDANEDPAYMEKLTQAMRTQPQPIDSWPRKLGAIIVADAFGYLVIGALPTEILEQNPLLLLWAKVLLVPFAIAYGIYIVGNVGRHQGQFKYALRGAYMGASLYFIINQPVVWISLLSSYWFNRHGKRWRRKPIQPRSLVSRLSTLAIMSTIYLSLWGCWFCFNCETTNKEGEPIKCGSYVMEFFESPSWAEFKKMMSDLKLYIQIHGISGLYRELKEMMGQDSEADAFAVLELSPNSTREEIMQRYRKMIRQWHPDKQRTSEDQEQAQEVFIKIQEAFNVLRKKGRAGRP